MPKVPSNVLIVDDDELVSLSIKLLLDPHFQKVVSCRTPERIPAMLRSEAIDVLLLDMNFRPGKTSGSEGLFWLRKVLNDAADVQVVLMTAYADIQVAIDALKEGALDFIVKPWQNEKLLATVRTAALVNQEKRKVRQLRYQRKGILAAFDKQYEPLRGEAESIREIKKTIAKVAPTDAAVLILGENGTGKEVIAREIHRQSLRHDEVFMSVDLGALSDTLFESELFGHRKGAFTDAREDRIGRFEAAAGGTLFLDEIGNVPLHLQVKLLTAIQQKSIVRLGTNEPIPVDVRIICATNTDLRKMATQGAFREDLLYRINTVEINVPPLRDRTEDVADLAEYFLERFNSKYYKRLMFHPDIFDELKKYRWPGNIRELQHAVERAVIMAEKDMLDASDFSVLRKSDDADFTFEQLNLEKLEAWAVRKAIAKHHGNISHAADELGISRGAIYRRIEKYGI